MQKLERKPPYQGAKNLFWFCMVTFDKNSEVGKDLQNSAGIFKTTSKKEAELFEAGVNNLNEFGYSAFINTTANNSSVQIASLAPTDHVTSEYLKRVYSKVQYW